MQFSRIAAPVLMAGALGAAILALSAAKPADDKSRLARGEYLTTVMSCNDCHTPGGMYGAPDFSRKFSGSELGWQGPWGVSFPRNLTPDMETGIGKWSEKEIVDALRTGMAPGGRVLNPPMPWPNFPGLSDADAYAIAAYLKSLPPVKHKVPDVIPPGQPVSGSVVAIPAPPGWDAPKGPPPGAK